MSKKLAVIGAGLMGSGIAQVAAAAGYEVAVRDVTDAALKRGVDGIRASLEKFASKGRYTAEEVEAAMARITGTTDLAEAVADADIVVEAAFEKVEIKQEIFRELDKLAKPGAVLATNTSAIPITQIAAVTSRPQDVVGTHFFSPVPMMQLCELVRGYKTADDTLAKARAFAEEVGKTCIVVNRDVAGFVTTRLIAALVVEAVFEDLEVKQGLFRELDKICRDGAVLCTNTSALPITQVAAVTRRPESVVGTHFFSPVPMMALCELVRGYQTSDETLAAAREFAEAVGKTCVVVNRDVAGFVTTRLITALIVEAAHLVESGVATAEDIDLACKLGFGHAMGPLATADLTGVDIIRNAARNIYTETHDLKFAPPELINRMVTAGALGRKAGKGFYDYEG